MDDQDVQVMGETFGQLAVATARVVGDLASALSKQPGIDGEKLIQDFLEGLPTDPTGLGPGHAIVVGLRAYLSTEQSDPVP